MLKFVRFAKSFKILPRYVQKRSFKDFDEAEFVSSINECGLQEVLNCTEVDHAAELLTSKLTKVLDTMAPVKKFQTRQNYVPWLSAETKNLKLERERAHEKAIRSDCQQDWRHFRAVRNQVTSRLKKDN